jgi:hypothetical protein
MARFNEILVGRYNRFLQKLLVLKGGPPSPQLSSEIGAGFVLFSGVENRYLEQWDRFGFQIGIGANAGFTSGVQMSNSLGSNVIMVLERLDITPVTTVQASSMINVTAGTFSGNLAAITGSPNCRMDRRGRSSCTAIFSSENTNAAIATLGNQYGTYEIGGTLPTVQMILTENQEITILPNDAIRIFSQVQNSGLNVNWGWRERLLEESERT